MYYILLLIINNERIQETGARIQNRKKVAFNKLYIFVFLLTPEFWLLTSQIKYTQLLITSFIIYKLNFGKV